MMNERLGRALAVLAFGEKRKAGDGGAVSAGRDETVGMLRERLRELEASGTEGRSVSGLPDKGCAQDPVFMEENADFFLDYLMGSGPRHACPGLIRHINDCYRCFEIYSDVMRGYVLERGSAVERR